MENLPAVKGLPELLQKYSAVDAQGDLRQDPIEGVLFRPVRPVSHEDGILAEVAKTSWPQIADPIVQVHVTTTLPGRTRAWGLHRNSTDRLFLMKGLVSFVVYDARLESPTYNCFNEFKLSERNPGLIIIPPNLYHGWKVIGTEEAYIINMPTSSYNYDEPDALDLPYDSPLATQIIPFRW